mmetsp:Transcript_48784/g.155999  ORF Transcript_48784/g.155999 Transcript_48784/m.155999 type:complete len:235 (+) Transcript_48784:120-824(+)
MEFRGIAGKDGRLVHSLPAKYVGEFLGSYFLVFTVGCNVLSGSIGLALSVGALVTAMVYAIGPVSGGHFNPAVSLAVLLTRFQRTQTFDVAVLLYIPVQLLGGILAGLTYVWTCGNSFPLQPAGKYYLTSTSATLEVVYTAALCYVVVNVMYVKSLGDNYYYGLAIGLTVTAATITIGGISGCFLNPATSLGVALVDASHKGMTAAFVHFPVYFFMPFLGSVLAVAMICVVNPA